MKIIELKASSKYEKNNHCFLFDGNNITSRRAERLFGSLEGAAAPSGEHVGHLCIQ